MLNERNQKGIFVNDRGYDSNAMFNFYFEKKQYFLIRLTEKRKVYLWFYQLARGIYNILSLAKTGIKDWQKIRKQKEYDGQISLI